MHRFATPFRGRAVSFVVHGLLSLSLVSSFAARARAASPSGADGPAPGESGAVRRPFDLGPYTRPVSTKVPAAQKAFDQGLAWAYAFNHDEARKAFREATRLDPSLAMAWWGVALINGPHINNPVVDEVHAKEAWEALGRARELAPGASDVERALIEALGSRYAWPQPADRSPLDAAYAAAMEKVRARFSDDADVATLTAEALMDTRPWDQWTRDGKPQPGTETVLAALEAARKLSPRHPGALHLTIHALEASPRPERAASAADALRGLVPDASHLVHMPSHIDVRTGRWREAADANEKAVAADERYRERAGEIGFYRLYMAHNRHFLAYTAMMEGRESVALARTREVVAGLDPAFVRENAAFADAYLTVAGDALKRFGKWKEILAAKAPPADLPVSTAFHLFLRGIAHAALGDVAAAEEEREAFAAALRKVPEDFYWGSNQAAAVLAVAIPYLDGEIAYRKKEYGTATAKLAEAVRLEDALKYDEPPAWTTPSRHALGAVLLATRRPAEAEAVYREDLVRYPGNGWSLWGLAQALGQQGKKAEAGKVNGRFAKAWTRAEIDLTSSCFCVHPGRPDEPEERGAPGTR